MAKSPYDRLVSYYEFQLGELPYRDEFKQALQATFSERDLQVVFLLPFLGQVTEDKLARKAARASLTREELLEHARRLMPQGLVDTYVGPKGRVYSRAPIIALLEFQVRLQEASPLREVCTKIMNAFIEGAVQTIPTKTPYYRVLPVEHTIRPAGEARVVPVNVQVPDPREVLPLDVVSEMVRRETLIAVSDCYCRSAKKLAGQGCDHPMETCFYFDGLAMVKLESGYARRIDAEEAIAILRRSEEAGLVHNVSNCEGKIQTLCNCCPCACGVLRATMRGQKNTGAPSRFRSALVEGRCTLSGACVQICPMRALTIAEGKLQIDAERCIGCGLCVSRCPNGALQMVPRDRPPRIYPTNDALFGRIYREAAVGLVLRKVRGK